MSLGRNKQFKNSQGMLRKEQKHQKARTHTCSSLENGNLLFTYEGFNVKRKLFLES